MLSVASCLLVLWCSSSCPLKLDWEVVKLNIEGFEVDMDDLRPLRYRVEDVQRSISEKAIMSLWKREVLAEVLHSEKMKEMLDENSLDALALKRNMRSLKEMAGGNSKRHLKYIPSYLLPSSLTETKVNFRAETGKGKKRKQEKDPLKSFSLRNGKKPRITHRERLLKYEPKKTDETKTIEELPPISGRKLWKLQHRKKLKKSKTDRTGMAGRKAINKRAKRHDKK